MDQLGKTLNKNENATLIIEFSLTILSLGFDFETFDF